ncbi:MAG: T9SS type A sorting domain-containing protein [Flavobacteriaceae bacterium]
MKKLVLTALMTLFLTNNYAQESQEINQPIDSLLKNVNKQTLTSGILYERVMPIANLIEFNKQNQISNLHHFEQALNEIYKASNKSKFIDYKLMRTHYDNAYNIVDVGIINTLINTLNYVEENENEGALKLNSNNVLETINGKDPFLLNHVFIAAPLKDYAMGNTITYRFKDSFIFQNTDNNDLAKLEVDFGDGQNRLIVQNHKIVTKNIIVNYTESGFKTLVFKATLTDGKIITTKGNLHIKLTSSNRDPDPLVDDFTLVSTIPFQGYEETEPVYGELEYRVFYHTNNGNTQRTLVKPIVIIDGFDPLDSRKIQDSDSPLPSEDHNSIEEMMIYYENNNKREIIPLLRELGYDVVIVNHPTYTRGTKTIDGGADYIERNAMNHVTLYQHLNNTVLNNGSNQQLVIVGPSMGGQISRYALSYMEKNNIPHNTRLWVSIDSPHLGANIPIGVQSLIHILHDNTDSVGAEDFVENWLGSTAAKQQLIEQYNGRKVINFYGLQILSDYLKTDYFDGKTISQGYSETRGHPFFTQFYNNMYTNGLNNSKGYPQNTRTISIVNGSLNGSKDYQNPFQNLGTGLSGTAITDQFANNGAKTLKIEGDANIIGHIVTLESYFMAAPNESHKSSYFKKKVFLGWDYYHRYAENINSRGNMDNIPGGWYPSQRDLAHAILGEAPFEPILGDITNWSIGVNDWNVDNLEHVSSFIPTASALGFKSPNFDWNETFDRNLVCTDEIPFDSYFGPSINEQHTSFTEQSVQWLLEELAGNPQDPYFPVKPDYLNGVFSVCSNQYKTYTFDQCKIPGNVNTWEVSPNLSIVSNTANSLTVTTNMDHRNSGWIKATFGNGITITKNIWVGKPATPTSLTGPSTVQTGALVNYNTKITGGSSSYDWILPYPFDVSNPINYFNTNWNMLPTTSNYITAMTGYGGNNGWVQVRGENNCGVGGVKKIWVTHDSNGGGGIPIANDDTSETGLPYNYFKVYPNPSNKIINIGLVNEKDKPEKNLKIFGELYDLLGNKLQHVSIENNKAIINVSRLITGSYILYIYSGNNIESHKIIIK